MTKEDPSGAPLPSLLVRPISGLSLWSMIERQNEISRAQRNRMDETGKCVRGKKWRRTWKTDLIRQYKVETRCTHTKSEEKTEGNRSRTIVELLQYGRRLDAGVGAVVDAADRALAVLHHVLRQRARLVRKDVLDLPKSVRNSGFFNKINTHIWHNSMATRSNTVATRWHNPVTHQNKVHLDINQRIANLGKTNCKAHHN